MKKLLLILLILMTALSFVMAQNYSDLEDSFQSFSDQMAEALPYASTIGLNWSNAYLGGFPHFGVGLTTGFVSLPADEFTAVAETLGVTLPDELFDLGIGVPLPAYTVDARLAIPILPVDVGVKVGYLEPSWTEGLTGGEAGVDYLLLGGDIRYGLMKEGVIKPAISVGLGYNYMKGGLYMDNKVPGQTISLEGNYNGVTDIIISDGDLYYEWNANVIDVKVQISKNLLILTPSIGAGYSYGFSSAGGGISATITDQLANPLDPADISVIEDNLGMDISNSGLSIFSEANGGSLRVWGGCSVNLFVLKLDLNAMYNLTSQSLGASLNARIQI